MIRRLLIALGYFLKFVYCIRILKSDQYLDIVYLAVKDLGGLSVKIIQFICLRTDIIPLDQKIKFLSFYDDVPPEPVDIRTVLTDGLGEEKLNYFKKVSDHPFACGTFAQVYRGELIDGTTVVIKVKRKNLRPKLLVDFLTLRLLAFLFNLVYYQKIVDIKKLVEEFESLTYNELDYLREARNACYFSKLYENHPYVYIPKTFLKLSTPNILVQEYIGGIALTDLIRARHYRLGQNYNEWLMENYNTDIRFVMKSLAYELGIQGFNYEKFYADPHPGNIKILPNNKWALIDFGIVGCSPRNKKNYYEITNLMLKKADELDTKRLGQEFLKWGSQEFYRCLEALDYLGSGTDLEEIISTNYMKLLDKRREEFRRIENEEEENFVKMYLDIIKTGQKYGVKLPQGMLAVLRTVTVYKSWCQFLEPQFHCMREVYKKILENVDRSMLINYEDLAKGETSLEEAIERAYDWLGSVAESDFPLYRKIRERLGKVTYV